MLIIGFQNNKGQVVVQDIAIFMISEKTRAAAKEVQPSDRYRDGIPRSESEGYCLIYTRKENQGWISRRIIRIAFPVSSSELILRLEPIT